MDVQIGVGATMLQKNKITQIGAVNESFCFNSTDKKMGEIFLKKM